MDIEFLVAKKSSATIRWSKNASLVSMYFCFYTPTRPKHQRLCDIFQESCGCWYNTYTVQSNQHQGERLFFFFIKLSKKPTSFHFLCHEDFNGQVQITQAVLVHLNIFQCKKCDWYISGKNQFDVQGMFSSEIWYVQQMMKIFLYWRFHSSLSKLQLQWVNYWNF